MNTWPVDYEYRPSWSAPRRSPWRRSLLASFTLHAALALIVLRGIASIHDDAMSGVAVEPLIRGALANLPAPPSETSTPPVEIDAEPVAVEPDTSVVTNAARTLKIVANAPAGSDALKQLIRKSSILEQISSPGEVGRMSYAITQSLGAAEWTAPTTSAPARTKPFDMDRGLLTNITRSDDGGRISFTETFGDRNGVGMEIVTTRLPQADGSFRYQQTLREPGRPAATFGVDAETWEAVEARYQPFAVIHSHPLVEQIHRQAVLPILEKLMNDSSGTPPATAH